MAKQAGDWDWMVVIGVQKCEKLFKTKTKLIQVVMEMENSEIIRSKCSRICF